MASPMLRRKSTLQVAQKGLALLPNLNTLPAYMDSKRLNSQLISMDDSHLLKKQRPILKPTSYDDLEVKNVRDKVLSYDQMPGPKGLPLIGTLWDYIRKDGYRFNKMFEAMKDRAAEFGPVYREKIMDRVAVIVSDPVEYAKVIRIDGKTPHRIEMEPMKEYRLRKGLSLGAVNSQGEEWYRHRTVLIKKTLRPKEVQEYCGAMSVVADDFMNKLRGIVHSGAVVPELDQELFKWALESVGAVLFESRIGALENVPSKDAQEFVHNLMGFFKYMQPLMYNMPIYKYINTPTWRIYENYGDKVHAAGLKLVQKRMEEIKNSTNLEEKSAFLTYLLAQKSLTPEEANSHAVDLMMGAVETTSNTSMFTLYCLARTPAAQEALRAEVTEVFRDSTDVTPEKIAQLPYVKACLKETFRLYPITFATSRFIKEDLELGGYHVPAGTHVQANLYGMGRDPALFTDPEVYRPERWLKSDDVDHLSTKSLTNLPWGHLTNLPWGHGARMCIGRRIAEQELYIMLSKLIYNFNVTMANNDSHIKPVLNTVMTPDRPLRLKFTPNF